MIRMTRTITQRELRNDSAAIMRAVEHGATVIVTRNGTPVAELRPVRRRAMVPTVELQRAFTKCPAVDYRAMRAEMDALLGEDRLDG